MKNKLEKIVFICLMVIMLMLLTACDIHITINEDTNKLQNNIAENTNNTNMEGIKVQKIDNDVFCGHKVKEWKKMVKKFYDTHYEMEKFEIEASFDALGRLCCDILVEDEVSDEYIFDPETGYARGWDFLAVDFTMNQYVEFIGENKVDFTDRAFLAVGYVPNIKYNEFIEKYYYSENDFDNIEIKDYRNPNSREPEYGNRFVFVPKTNFVKYTIYDAFLNDNGELEKDNTLVKDVTEPLVVLEDYIEYIPNMIIEYEYNGIKGEFSINFSGDDGHLILDGAKEEVMDITVY